MNELYELLKQLVLGITGSLVLVSPNATAVAPVTISATNTVSAVTKKVVEGLPFPVQAFGKILNIKGVNFSAVIADTVEKREQGLSGTNSIGSNQAMLFIFDTPGKYAFWMKDMSYAIDMIWLDMAGRVVYMAKNATPESFPKSFKPNKDALIVIEVKAGTANRLGLSEGDKVTLPSK